MRYGVCRGTSCWILWGAGALVAMQFFVPRNLYVMGDDSRVPPYNWGICNGAGDGHVFAALPLHGVFGIYDVDLTTGAVDALVNLEGKDAIIPAFDTSNQLLAFIVESPMSRVHECRLLSVKTGEMRLMHIGEYVVNSLAIIGSDDLLFVGYPKDGFPSDMGLYSYSGGQRPDSQPVSIHDSRHIEGKVKVVVDQKMLFWTREEDGRSSILQSPLETRKSRVVGDGYLYDVSNDGKVLKPDGGLGRWSRVVMLDSSDGAVVEICDDPQLSHFSACFVNIAGNEEIAVMSTDGHYNVFIDCYDQTGERSSSLGPVVLLRDRPTWRLQKKE
ncbi:hypothetical protein [Rubinisphaera margarita]|uniref:hypothetical protein n=1 Tax=Rubinisphaera margarita TaxID=2909586 RepID=UPI001EE7ABD1|nr:hypothetical protein [Rubinisphaera margarita]MCG6154172.1 hypothetical protein [Rubinisphaera margarita]